MIYSRCIVFVATKNCEIQTIQDPTCLDCASIQTDNSKFHACADSPTKYWHPQQNKLLPTPRSVETFLERLYNLSCCRISSGCYANVFMLRTNREYFGNC